MKFAESAANQLEATTAVDILLSNDGIWNDCALGPVHDWPQPLQTVANFIMSLTHPAAVFWSNDLVLIYNNAWREAATVRRKQGRPQKDELPKDIASMLQSAVKGQIPPEMTSQDLLTEKKQKHAHHILLCSPMYSSDDRGGVVVQILSEQQRPQAREDNPDRDDNNESNGETDQKDDKGGDEYIQHDETALDRQPFFQKFAEMLPTGLAILNHKAEALFVNQQFHELTAHEGSDRGFKTWPETIHPDDYDRVMSAYREAFEARTNLSVQFRAFGRNNPWRLFQMRPLGKVNLRQTSLQQHGGFICAVVDITDIKAAEISQKKAAHEAQERKQQQERFIDMISHEIRNPLSAVLHCAEDILEAVHSGDDTKSIPVDEIIDSAHTITLCVAHQKNLVDDVLSYSKLDASMLSLAPRSTQPKWALSETLKIFQPELRKLSIQFDYTIDASYDKQKVDWVMADMVRISQVLVNLMTNAIKFTSKKDGDKKISVAIGASLEKPTSYPPNVVFFEADEKLAGKDTTNDSEWGKGESLYIMVAVRDTGVGISPANQAKLFERFRQATPKTGEMYGGSGLGLNISRKLCQLHGGEVGVSSREAYGSTFGFFFKAHRSEQPSQEAGLDPEELRQKLRASGDMDSTDVAEDEVPHDLREPPTREITEANPSGSMNDDRLEHTQDISDKANDEYRKSKEQEKEDNPTIARTGVDLKDEDKQRAEAEASQYRDEKPAVLFVEDNLINQKLLKRKMEARGFAVTTANNGREAVDAYLEHSQDKDGVAPFNVVLMDQEMPVMDGNAASREIRRYEEEHGRPSVRIIGVTANVRDEQTEEMRNAGMNDILSKPFRIEELIKKMRLDSGCGGSQAE